MLCACCLSLILLVAGPERSSTFRRGVVRGGPPPLYPAQPSSFSLTQHRLVHVVVCACEFLLLRFLVPSRPSSACTCLFPVHRTFSFLRSCVYSFLFALSYSCFVQSLPSQQFFFLLFPPPLNVHRQHGLAAACFIVSLGTAVGPILALRGARHGILLGLLLNGTSAEMRTCKGEGGGGRGLVHAAPHRASVPPRGLATTAVFLLGAQHWLGSCLFLFLFFWPMCDVFSEWVCVLCLC